MSTYEERRAAEAAQIVADEAKLDEMTAYFPEGWTKQRPRWMGSDDRPNGAAEFHGPNGAVVYVKIETWQGKRKGDASGRLPDGDYYRRDYDTGEIGFSSDKSAELIARDIVRRCLPKYLPSLERANEAIRKAGEAEAKRQAIADHLAEVAGSTNREGSISIPGAGWVDVRSEKYVRFERFSVNAEAAERMIRALLAEVEA